MRGLFRSASGATIKNLTVQTNGFDVDTSTYDGKKFGAGVLVGTTNGGLSVENCIVEGELGTDEIPCAHTTAGIIANIDLPADGGSARSTYVVKNCTSRVNMKSTRKAGGIIGFAEDDIVLENVKNEGLVARVTSSHPSRTGDATRGDDAVGGIVGYGNHNQNSHHPVYMLGGLENSGDI